MAKTQIVVETYHNDKQLAKGRERMAKRGYEFESEVVDSRTGCLRKIMGGYFFARPKVYHTVTYKLAATDD